MYFDFLTILQHILFITLATLIQYHTKFLTICPHVCLQSDSTCAKRLLLNPQDSESDSNEESGEEEQDVEELELATITLQLKGTTFHGHQQSLKRMKSLGNEMRNVDLELKTEPSNPVDKNAVKIFAVLNGIKEPLGYVSVYDLPRVREAMNNSSVTHVSVVSVTGRYVLAAKSVVYSCRVAVTKRGRWPPKDVNNVYNSDI